MDGLKVFSENELGAMPLSEYYITNAMAKRTGILSTSTGVSLGSHAPMTGGPIDIVNEEHRLRVLPLNVEINYNGEKRNINLYKTKMYIKTTDLNSTNVYGGS